jgi:RimJ/RimL family protein N-acetyltransferase
MSGVPRLETERLIMREWSSDDADAHAAMCADPEVMRFLGGPIHAAQSWRAMALHAGHWSLRGYGNWVLERRDDHSFVGRTGFWNPHGWPGLEIGWTLARGAWGKGFATEAARAALEWGWAELDTDRLISVIAPENDASLRVAERLGMYRLRDDQLAGTPVVIFALDRP